MATRQTQLLQRWRANLELFREDLGYLLWSRQIYRRLREIIEANRAIQQPWTFHDWVIRNYVTATVMAGSRLLDRNSLSLRKLLEEMKSNPNMITRELYLSHFANRDMDADRLLKLPDKEFDRLAGPGATALGVDAIQKDINLLVEAWKPFKTLRDKQIAHRVPTASLVMPTYAELDVAIDSIHPVLKRYELMLLGVASSAERVAQFDWDTVFKKAWIQKRS